MISQSEWFRENFAFSHASAGVVVYGFAIAIVNFDKTNPEILVLVTRQAFMTFLFTGFLVPLVQRRALSTNMSAVIF